MLAWHSCRNMCIETSFFTQLSSCSAVLIYGAMSSMKGEFNILDCLYGGKTITGTISLPCIHQAIG